MKANQSAEQDYLCITIGYVTVHYALSDSGVLVYIKLKENSVTANITCHPKVIFAG